MSPVAIDGTYQILAKERGDVPWNVCAACCAYIKFSFLYQLVKNGMKIFE